MLLNPPIEYSLLCIYCVYTRWGIYCWVWLSHEKRRRGFIRHRKKSNCCANASQSEINQIINERIESVTVLAVHLLSSTPAWHDRHKFHNIRIYTHTLFPIYYLTISMYTGTYRAFVLYPIRVVGRTCRTKDKRIQSRPSSSVFRLVCICTPICTIPIGPA
jgi:hypothetical protein